MENLHIFIDTIHTIFCMCPHGEDMMDVLTERKKGVCYYYLEKSITEEWNLPDHVKWTKKAEEILSRLKCTQPEDGLKKLYRILDIVRRIEGLSDYEIELIISLLPQPSDRDG